MHELEVRRWKIILEAMASRNRNGLTERQYITLVGALEGWNDPRALRKLAIDTATALGKVDGGRLPPLGPAPSNVVHNKGAPETKPEAPSTSVNTRNWSESGERYRQIRRSRALF